MYERLMITFVMVAFFWAVLLLMKRRQITLANRASRSNKQTSKPTIVYFGSNGCAVCKRAQRPILEKILAEYGNEQLGLTVYDADESPDIAKEWGVMTLPTTFLLDSRGTIRHVNNGLAVSGTLRKQLEPMMKRECRNQVADEPN